MITALPPIFAGLHRDAVDEAAARLRTIPIAVGDPLMIEGEDDRTVAFVATGTVELWHGETKVGTAGPREMLGECELFSDIPRLCSATAASDVVVHALPPEDYAALCERGNPIVHAIERASIRRLGDRLRLLSASIADRAKGRKFELAARTSPSFFQRLKSSLGQEPRGLVNPAEVLANSPMFAWADRDVVDAISSYFSTTYVDHDAFLCRQGDPGTKMFVLVDGEVEVVLLMTGSKAEQIARIHPGQAFGDTSIAMGTPRTATCVARGKVTALEMDRADYVTLHALDAFMGSVFRQSMIRNLVEHLRATLGRFVQLDQAYAERRRALEGGTPANALWQD